MNIEGKKIAFALTSSFYAFSNTIIEIRKIVEKGGEVIAIMSQGAYITDTKYGKAKDFRRKIEEATGREVIHTLEEAENVEADIITIAPCSRKYNS